MRNIDKRLERLEALRSVKQEEWIETDDGWTLLLRDGKCVKAWHGVSPRNWDTKGYDGYENN